MGTMILKVLSSSLSNRNLHPGKACTSYYLQNHTPCPFYLFAKNSCNQTAWQLLSCWLVTKGVMWPGAGCQSGRLLGLPGYLRNHGQTPWRVLVMKGWKAEKYNRLTNPTHLSHIPLYTIQNRNVHISVLNGALCDLGMCIVGFNNYVNSGCHLVAIPGVTDSVFKINDGLRTLTDKIWVGPASFPSFIIYTSKFRQNCASMRQVSDLIMKTVTILVTCHIMKSLWFVSNLCETAWNLLSNILFRWNSL